MKKIVVLFGINIFVIKLITNFLALQRNLPKLYSGQYVSILIHNLNKEQIKLKPKRKFSFEDLKLFVFG